MLLRGQNILGYRHYGDDVVDAFVERAAANGVDVFRIFDALNDTRNMERAIIAVKQANKHAQGTISFTTSPFHTNERFIELGLKLEKMGCNSICIKDMAGLLTPTSAFDLVAGLKSSCKIPIALHSHATTGMATTTLFKAIEAEIDMVDTAISTMSLGTSHPPTETIVAMLSGTRHDTELRMDVLSNIARHFRGVRKNYAEFESAFAGADTRILTSQIPGGMLSNLENQLRQQNAADRLDDVMNEIPQVRKELGYPPLVTPTSQIVGTQAVLNVLQGERYKTITAETKGLLGGHYGRTPAPMDKDIQRKAIGDEEPITCRPADLIKPEIEKLKAEMDDKSAPLEDVLINALFPKVAPGFFKSRPDGPKVFTAAAEPAKKGAANVAPAAAPSGGVGVYTVTVDGVAYNVAVSEGKGAPQQGTPTTHVQTEGIVEDDALTVVDAPLAGRVIRLVKQPGDAVAIAETVMVIEAMKMETEIKASEAGTLHRFFANEGVEFGHGEPLYAIKKA
jgi:oxaloacetate decarboxylase (Na+ extruding) subunit alpha